MLNAMTLFPTGEADFLLPGPVGSIEVHTSTPTSLEKSITMIICHPHPLMGGTMNNKVVTTVARACREMGIHSVRFNFRGVGQSAGDYTEGVGEADDVSALLAWVRAVRPHDTLYLAGFSFGAYVALRTSTREPDIAHLTTIAPAIHLRGFTDLPLPTCPWLLIQGDQDEVVSASDVYAWVETLPNPPHVIRMETAGHFFHGGLNLLRDHLITELSSGVV